MGALRVSKMPLMSQEYDPSLAEKTLALARDRGDAAVERKKRNMLASLVRAVCPCLSGMAQCSDPVMTHCPCCCTCS